MTGFAELLTRAEQERDDARARIAELEAERDWIAKTDLGQARSQVAALREALVDARTFGWPGAEDGAREQADHVLADTATVAAARDARMVAQAREKAIGIVEYSIDNEVLRERLVARIREGMEQHPNRALPDVEPSK